MNVPNNLAMKSQYNTAKQAQTRYDNHYDNHRDNHNASSSLNQSSNKLNKYVDKNKGAPMTKVVTLEEHAESSIPSSYFTQQQLDILKNSICKGITNEEFQIFLMACQKTQLDPFMRQIYAVKRKSKKPDGSWGETMTIQTGIDGYRLIAERTEKYAPGQEPSYVCDQNGRLISATAYVKKQTKDGTWHTISASAYMEEYCQTILDRTTGEKKPVGMWVNMPRTMLAKCAEAQALRKAFPAEMSGVYTKEEMAQANDPEHITQPEYAEVKPKITFDQAVELNMLLDECEENYRKWFSASIKKNYNANNVTELPAEVYERAKAAITKNMDQYHDRQKQQFEASQLAEKVQ